MIPLALALCLLQDLGTDALLERLADDAPDVREKAVAALVARGPDVVPTLLALHRSASSPEVRERAALVLQRFPFPAFVGSRPGEPLRESLRGILLRDLKKHRETPACVIAENERVSLDVLHLRILRQEGSGHGQFLALDETVPDGAGGLRVRRIVYQGMTPYRPQVKEEGVRVEESLLGPAESAALVELLAPAVALRPDCGVKRDSSRSWTSSGSFSMRFQIESGKETAWSVAFTGYRSSSDEPAYAHGMILDGVLRAAVATRAWTPAEVTPDDRRRALAWLTRNFDPEGWWIREHYLDMARFIGDESYVPFLTQVANNLEGKDGPSEVRQLKSAREALSRIASARK